MKSLVLKDLFNIGHNAKSMLFILVVFAVALIPFSGVEGYAYLKRRLNFQSRRFSLDIQ